MGDPIGAATHVRKSLATDGTWMIVEPFANDKLEDNLTPVGRVYYSLSTLLCTPCSRSQEVGLCLGAQAGEKRLREVATAGGFSEFRCATQTPFNLVFEARPWRSAKRTPLGSWSWRRSVAMTTMALGVSRSTLYFSSAACPDRRLHARSSSRRSRIVCDGGGS
jgi:hypothetical protein